MEFWKGKKKQKEENKGVQLFDMKLSKKVERAKEPRVRVHQISHKES